MDKLYVDVIDVPKVYGHLLAEARDVFSGRDIFHEVRYSINHAEVLNFVGLEPKERQRCPFHESDTGTSFQIIMGDKHKGKTVRQYPRFRCCSTKPCIAYHSFDTVEFLVQLYPSLSRWDVAKILLMAKQTGQLVDTDLQAGGGKSSDKKSFRGRLERLHTRREKHFPIPKLGTIPNFKSVMHIEVAFPILFTEPQGRLCIKGDIGHTPNIKTRDYWLRTRLNRQSYIVPHYLRPEATNAQAPNIIAREWLVIEGDERLSLRQQIRVHHGLEGYRGFHLSLLCYSGGKSIHGWYYAFGRKELDCFRLYWHAVYQGMDLACFGITQPVRLPGGFNHKTQKEQTIIEWNL